MSIINVEEILITVRRYKWRVKSDFFLKTILEKEEFNLR